MTSTASAIPPAPPIPAVAATPTFWAVVFGFGAAGGVVAYLLLSSLKAYCKERKPPHPVFTATAPHIPQHNPISTIYTPTIQREAWAPTPSRRSLVATSLN